MEYQYYSYVQNNYSYLIVLASIPIFEEIYQKC